LFLNLNFKELKIFIFTNLTALMTFSSLLFYFFSICLVTSTSIVVTSRHPIFSIVFLAISFIFSSLLLFLLECEFLALLFLVIYLGAVLVLFLFAVMMLEFKLTNLLVNQIKYIPIGLTFSILLFSCFLTNINLNYYKIESDFNYLYLNTYQN
jgi:NADH:ubiquinone oxidoreductase subunit 6 (subunit J)